MDTLYLVFKDRFQPSRLPLIEPAPASVRRQFLASSKKAYYPQVGDLSTEDCHFNFFSQRCPKTNFVKKNPAVDLLSNFRCAQGCKSGRLGCQYPHFKRAAELYSSAQLSQAQKCYFLVFAFGASPGAATFKFPLSSLYTLYCTSFTCPSSPLTLIVKVLLSPFP